MSYGIGWTGWVPYCLDQSETLERGRLTIFREPEPQTYYTMGLDGAYGLDDGDFDAAQILDDAGRQCAVAEGHWGPENLPAVLWPLVQWYQPFVVGEQQICLPTLRTLLEMGYTWLYWDRDEAKRGKPIKDKLGHFKRAEQQGDPILKRLAAVIGPRDGAGKLLEPLIEVYDERTLQQCVRFGWHCTKKNISPEEAHNQDLKLGAPPGEHDDLVLALGYAVTGLKLLPQWPKPEKVFAKGTLGYVLGHNNAFKAKPPTKSNLGRRRKEAERDKDEATTWT